MTRAGLHGGSRVGVGVMAAGLVGAFAGAGAVALLNPWPDQSPLVNASQALLVTAPVEDVAERALVSVAGTLRPAVTVGVNQTTDASGANVGDAAVPEAGMGGQDGAAGDRGALGDAAAPVPAAVRQVVSKEVMRVGDVVYYGDLVAEVSGRPVFAVPASLPLYRDLVVGSVGNDVKGVQELLAGMGLWEGTPNGVLGAGTMKAIAGLYADAGYNLAETSPGVKGLLISETAPVPATGLGVASVCPVGAVPDSAERPLVAVTTEAPAISARINILEAATLQAGTEVMVSVGAEAPVTSQVAAVSEFSQPEPSTPGGYDITVALPEGLDPEALGDKAITITEVATIGTAPGVPLTAIRESPEFGTFVLVPEPVAPTSGTLPPMTKVTVVVLGQNSGMAILEPNPELPVGTDVVVAGA